MSARVNPKNAVFVTLGIYPGGQTRTATEVRAQQNLAALRALGYEVTIATTPDKHGRPLDGKVVLLEPPPTHYFVGLHAHWRYRRKLHRQIARLAGLETVIFCEHWAALLCAPRHPRVVYSFHDFESKLITVRRLRKLSLVNWKTRAYWRVAAWLERHLLRRAARVICVSASEAATLRTEWGVSQAEYIPIVPFAEPSAPGEFKTGPMRLWFYGGSAATSNKIILDHLMGTLFGPLFAALPEAEFHQLGAYNTYDAEKIDWLRQHFIMHGFVEDPATCFRPGDICLMPYEQDTGFRTKIPEVCGYGVIPAGYDATFACCPEMRDGHNCVSARNPAGLVEKLAHLQADEPARRRLAANAYETRRREFSFDALLERYRRILNFN